MTHQGAGAGASGQPARGRFCGGVSESWGAVRGQLSCCGPTGAWTAGAEGGCRAHGEDCLAQMFTEGIDDVIVSSNAREYG